MNRLTEVRVCKAKPGKGFYKISEGGGIYLLLHHNGSNYWRINYLGLREVVGCMRLLALYSLSLNPSCVALNPSDS